MNKLRRSITLIFVGALIVSCGSIETEMPSITVPTPSITPSSIPSVTLLPTNTYTVTPEPDIAPNCKISDEAGHLYLLSDQEIRDLRTHEGILDQALASHYPEWANYTQLVSWSTQPVKLGEVIVSASLSEQLNLQINPAVTLVVLGESVDWELPPNTDIFLKSREISTELNRLSFAWDNPYNESLRNQNPEVANSGTFALYSYFNGDLSKMENWCHTYLQLFGE